MEILMAKIYWKIKLERLRNEECGKEFDNRGISKRKLYKKSYMIHGLYMQELLRVGSKI